ncbi:MAG: metal-sensing transcriptional repressor, partial [candidate division NC10 bacterium]|nr:metal-sensing transcriptional repressor [candidate division NC10 bacterium]
MAKRQAQMTEGKQGGALQRLNRIEGQIRGLKKMLEEDRYCVE